MARGIIIMRKMKERKERENFIGVYLAIET